MSGDAGTQRKFTKRLKRAGLSYEGGPGDGIIVYAPDGQRLGFFIVLNPHSVKLAEKKLADLGYVIP